MKYRVEIPFKLPSCNDYINACRRNRFAGAKMKVETEKAIGEYFADLPKFEYPIKIHFTWIEKNKRRDPDNCCFAKKFILDAMVTAGVLENDNRKCVYAFTDSFKDGTETKVLLEIEEVKNDTTRTDH